MRPGSQIPPLLKVLNSEYPYSVWIDFCLTPEEYFLLHQMFLVLPKTWIEWCEKIVTNKIKRGIKIKNPLAYRHNLLWNGIVNLEEIKFIIDILENSFRKIFVEYLDDNLKYIDYLRQLIPKSEKNNQKLFNEHGWDFVMCLSFYQLTETMIRTWFGIKNTPVKYGFFDYFQEKNLKDKNLFKKDMKYIRKRRNEIAHTKMLFGKDVVMKVILLANKWLTPLNVDVIHYVNRYRTYRPDYLRDFDAYLRHLSSRKQIVIKY